MFKICHLKSKLMAAPPMLLLLAMVTVVSSTELKLVLRSDWGAQPPNAELTKFEMPVKRVVIIHTATAECHDEEHCMQEVRAIQNFQMKSAKFDDISYSFLVGNDGQVYEGRGWDQQAAFARSFNVGSLGVAFIGNYNQTTPVESALEAAKALIEEGVKLGKIHQDYKLFGHRQLIATNSPGDALYALIKQWPKWNRNISI